MNRITKLMMILFLALASIIPAQKGDYSDEPGFLDFGDLTQYAEDDFFTEIILEKNLLKIFARAGRENEDWQKLVGGLKLIKVNVFNLTEKNEAVFTDKVNSFQKELFSKNWDRIIKAREEGTNVNIFIKAGTGDDINGLVVMAIDKDDFSGRDMGQAVFINIVGSIDLEAVLNLTEHFTDDSIDRLISKSRKER